MIDAASKKVMVSLSILLYALKALETKEALSKMIKSTFGLPQD
jgi:hypothetical protein